MKKTIIGIVIGIIISTTTVYAASILSISVVYDNSISNGSSKTVQGALDELYNKVKYGDATSEDILEGKTALVQGQEVVGTLKKDISNIVLIEEKVYNGARQNVTLTSSELLAGTYYILLFTGISRGSDLVAQTWSASSFPNLNLIETGIHGLYKIELENDTSISVTFNAGSSSYPMCAVMRIYQ